MTKEKEGSLFATVPKEMRKLRLNDGGGVVVEGQIRFMVGTKLYAVPDSHKELLDGATHECVHIAEQGVDGPDSIKESTVYPAVGGKQIVPDRDASYCLGHRKNTIQLSSFCSPLALSALFGLHSKRSKVTVIRRQGTRPPQ